MRSGLLLSVVVCVAGFVGIMGCASGSVTTSTGGSGSGGGVTTDTSSSSSSTSASSSTSSSGSSTSSSSGAGGTGGMGATGGTGGMPQPGLPLGSDCTQDSDCDSMLCKPVVIGTNPVCVTPCTQNSDCGASANFFCEPISGGSTDGYCIPHSPAHCLSCMQDSDCGSLSEVCFQAPGDINKACHIDCSIAGDAACPSDYSCTDQMVNGTARKLCRPKIIPTCLDALGGFCDRLQLPQPCVRQNAAGTCLGERSCLPGSKRFDKCSAQAPQCKTDCSVQDPAGCMEAYCAGATNTVTNCGSCGNVCPGYMTQNANVTCNPSLMCTFSCQGEHYDVDGQTSNGCEVADAPQGNHVQSSAADQGSISDCDSGGTDFTFTGRIMSDTRVHENPAIVGFDSASGSAPDWFTVIGVGHTFCQNDLVLTLSVSASNSPACYKLTVITDKVNYSCQTSSSGTCSINHNSGGQFSDDTPIKIEVQKTCSTSLTENVAYSISGHF